MQTECVRCHKAIDTVQGYKFSPTEYVCMSCYDEYKAERVAKAREKHKNPLIDQFGTEGRSASARQSPPQMRAEPKPTAPQPGAFSTEPAETAGPVQPASRQEQAPPPVEPISETAAPQSPSSAEICGVCKKPVSDFMVPLKGGKKVCMGCNETLRDVAKSLILNIQCPHCGEEIQLTQM